MIVSYPLNPVCVCATAEFYEKLIAFAKKNEIVILHDNAYSDITYGDKPGKSFLSFEGALKIKHNITERKSIQSLAEDSFLVLMIISPSIRFSIAALWRLICCGREIRICS